MRSLICFAVKLPPRIFSYKPHSIPSANNLPPGLTGQQSPAAPIFLYRANLSLLLATTFRQGAFGAGLNLMASNLSLSFFLFLSFCSLFFLLFPHHVPPYPFFIQYTEFLFFPYFFTDFCTKNSTHYWML